MKLEYEVFSKEHLSDPIRNDFVSALKKQGKVQGDIQDKADRCRFICIARIDGEMVGIGAIKVKTQSDFSSQKADLPDLSKEFRWELGYLFTEPEHMGKGVAKYISRLLTDAIGNENLMATTELSANPAMVRILEHLGFRHYGKPWKSNIHENYLGLFLKFK